MITVAVCLVFAAGRPWVPWKLPPVASLAPKGPSSPRWTTGQPAELELGSLEAGGDGRTPARRPSPNPKRLLHSEQPSDVRKGRQRA